MKIVDVNDIARQVAAACIEANCVISQDLEDAYLQALDRERQESPRSILKDLYENACIALQQSLPVCQDTGTAVIFVRLGQDVRIRGGLLYEAISEGVARGYQEGYLRKSIVRDPFIRENTGDNTPPVIHLELTGGDGLEITVAPKGGGSENMSRLAMLPPSAGEEGFLDFVVETVRLAGPNPCPPVVVGACAGGNFETCALNAKKALLRPIGEPSADPRIRRMEEILLARISGLNIGPQGFGGDTTAFAVHVELAPCHLASLPVAVNLNCHVSRHRTVIW